MSQFEQIKITVQRAGSRRRRQRVWWGLWQGLLAGALVWFFVLGFYKLFPLPEVTVTAAGATALGAILVGVVVGGWRRDGLLSTARWLDERQQLQERLSTALEMGRDPRLGRWGELLVQDAARQVEGVEVRRLLPYALPQASRWVLLLLTLSLTLGFVPEYRTQQYKQKQRDKEVVREVGRQLMELTRRSMERRQPALERTRATQEAVGELGSQLNRNPLGRNEALRDLGKMTEKVQQESKELAKNPALKAMERASQSGRNNPASADELQKQIDALQQSLGQKQANNEALDKLRSELQKAMQAAADLMAKGSQGQEAAKDSLAKALSNLAKQAQDMGASLPSLEEAISALEAGKIDQVLKDLKVAERDLEKIREMAQALQKMQQQAAQIGKDLAEQLKNGQAEAAINTLQKMANQLKSGDLSAEQADAIMKELAKAVGPAAPYGKVADHLREAGKQMAGGDKAGAAKALEKAAKELQDLLAQMADAQDLAATMDALKRAQMCVGNGNMWGLVPAPPRAGKGGKPGSGVGTWADESNWMDAPEQSDQWDNSQVQRPDYDPRGMTDRGEGELPPGMTSTKIKGQFNPGGQMPSITLKGFSIKGQSTVAIQEAAQAAQSDAQSALSQEKVPRAYRGAVKDYFDDIQK